MISADVVDFELLAEKLLLDAYSVRDTPCWKNFVSLLQTVAQVGAHLQEREQALSFADKHLLP